MITAAHGIALLSMLGLGYTKNYFVFNQFNFKNFFSDIGSFCENHPYADFG